MPEWFAPVVSVIALVFSVLSPVLLGFFDLRKAAREREMAFKREKRQELVQLLDSLIEARSMIEGRASAGHRYEILLAYSKAYAIMISIPDSQMQALAPGVMAGDDTERLDAFDKGIRRLGEILSQKI